MDKAEPKKQVAAEVLELGEMLFESIIADAAQRQPPAGDEDTGYPAEELLAAAEQFFEALRLLLGLAGDQAAPPAGRDEVHDQMGEA